MAKNLWHEVPASDTMIENSVNAIIEIPEGSSCKYEYDKEYGIIRLDRVLFTSTHYPTNYGFIPQTYSDDNDPLDILVYCRERMVPGILCRAKIIGVAIMVDGGENDEKIIAVSADDPSYDKINSIRDIPPHLINEMTHFFEVYKELEGKKTKVMKVKDRDEALAVVRKCMDTYKKKKSKLMKK